MRRLLIPLGLVVLLGGCDMLGIETTADISARREAEGKAVGGACRNAGRAIEDCFALNRKVDKAAIIAGWRDMNDYMRENKIEPTPPQLTTPTEVAKAPPAEEAPAEEAKKPAAKAEKAEKPDKGEKAEKADKRQS